MEILLIKPYWPYPYSRREFTYNRIWPPLCLLNCASLLEKEGHNVKILDASLSRIRPHMIADYVKGYDKVFITSSTLDRWQCPNIEISTFLETAKFAKKITDEVYVMGYHGTVNPEEILSRSQAKAVIRGEPEQTVVEVCNENDLSKIKGLSFRLDGNIISNPDRELIDLKTLPTPAYHLLDINRYTYEILGSSFALLETSRGCLSNCSFCNKIMYGRKLRVKSKEQAIQEIQTLIERHKVKSGYYIDLDFLSNKEVVDRLCEYLIKSRLGFKWACQTRPNLLDLDILAKMKKGGCQLIHIGIETGSQDLLNSLNKNISITQARKAVSLCRKIGIKTLAFFLFGFLEEKNSDRMNSFKFAKELDTDFVSFHKIFPFAKTKFYCDNFSFNEDKEIDTFIKTAMCKYYFRPAYLQRLDIFTFLSGLRLFYGRLKTLQ